MRYVVGRDAFVSNDFVNITDAGGGVVRMSLRYRPDEWCDGDRATRNKDRQRLI